MTIMFFVVKFIVSKSFSFLYFRKQSPYKIQIISVCATLSWTTRSPPPRVSPVGSRSLEAHSGLEGSLGGILGVLYQGSALAKRVLSPTGT